MGQKSIQTAISPYEFEYAYGDKCFGPTISNNLYIFG